jgi:hypothetical protein
LAFVILCAGLGACTSGEIVDSADTGVGFGDYETYLAERQAREAQLQGVAAPVPEATGAPAATATPAAAGVSASDLAAAGIGVSGQGGASPLAAAPVSAAPVSAVSGASGPPLAAPGMAAAAGSGGGAPVIERAGTALSEEQDFAAVSARETIESDAARLERQRATYAQVAPPPMPAPVAGTGPDIVRYALATSHPVGQQLYRRPFGSEARASRACRRYAGADLAQRAFLAAGGPERDRMGLDPDGDGFVCGWNPAPFRAVRG